MGDTASCCKGVMLLVLAMSWFGAVTAQDGHDLPCSKGWLQHGTSCYLYNDTAVSQQEAAETCLRHQAHLVFIRNDSENYVVEGFLHLASSSVWIGARFSTRSRRWVWAPPSDNPPRTENRVWYQKWKDGFHFPMDNAVCAMMEEGGWWTPTQCSRTLPFLCEKHPGCQAGWYSPDCSAQCHCHGGKPCHQVTGLCPSGCMPGWTGVSCNTANPMPDASFHCLKTKENELRADLTVDVKMRRYRVVQAVDEDGNPISCSLHKLLFLRNNIYVTLLLPNASSDENEGVEHDVANASDVTTASTARHEVTMKEEHHFQATTPRPSAAKGGKASPDRSAGKTITEADNNETIDATVSVTASGKEGSINVKRDADSNGHSQVSSGKGCVASRTENGSVTWLIEFKEYPDVMTGNDVTVEVTCDLDVADTLEPVDSVFDDSEPEQPMVADITPVKTSAYLRDHYSGQRVERFHLGQRLQLHVDIEGLAEHECGFPHSCMLRPAGGPGQEIQLLGKDGCGGRDSPVRYLQTTEKGHFVSNDFPAFSLGSSAVLLDCQVDVKIVRDDSDCSTFCQAG